MTSTTQTPTQQRATTATRLIHDERAFRAAAARLPEHDTLRRSLLRRAEGAQRALETLRTEDADPKKYTRGHTCRHCGRPVYNGYPFTVCDDCWPKVDAKEARHDQ